MRSARLLRPIWAAFAALVLGFSLLGTPAFAQADGMSQQGTGSNPTAQSVTEQQLLQELKKVEGRVSIPNTAAGLLQQPQGRDYRSFHEGALPWIAGIAILGMLAALLLFLAIKGRIRTERTAETGSRIKRFNWFERLNHWMTATAFIVLAITGVNYFFGKRLLMPLIGPDAFSGWSHWAKFAHNFIAWPFMIGIVLMLLVWIKDNIPNRSDWAWIRSGGGFFGGRHVATGRFNAGQKAIFWTVVLGGLALSASGIVMLFPFSFTDINGMQWAQYVHASVGVIMIAVILAHIYIGSIGMEGSFEAMGSGDVDLGWARAHHSAWVAKKEARAGIPSRAQESITPAE